MQCYRAWYRKTSQHGAFQADQPDWVVRARDEGEATAKALATMDRSQPEHGFTVFLLPIADEDEATVTFAAASQRGQAVL